MESRQSNGPVEHVVEIVRQHAAVLASDLERESGTSEGQTMFRANHPIYSCTVCCTAWVCNRFSVNLNPTAYEVITGSSSVAMLRRISPGLLTSRTCMAFAAVRLYTTACRVWGLGFRVYTSVV